MYSSVNQTKALKLSRRQFAAGRTSYVVVCPPQLFSGMCRNKNAAAAAAKSEMLAKVQRAEQILEAQQKR